MHLRSREQECEMRVENIPRIISNFPTKNGRAVDVTIDNLGGIVFELVDYLLVYVKLVMMER